MSRFGVGESIFTPFVDTSYADGQNRYYIPAFGMGAARLTAPEIDAYQRARTIWMKADFAYNESIFRDLLSNREVAFIDAVTSGRIPGLNTVPQGLRGLSWDNLYYRVLQGTNFDTRDTDLRVKRDTYNAYIARASAKSAGMSGAASPFEIQQLATRLFAVDYTEKDYTEVTDRIIMYIGRMMDAAKDVNDAVDDIWEKTSVIAEDFPVFGTLSLGDAKFAYNHGLPSLQDAIDAIKEIDYSKIGEGVIHLAPYGYADAGLEALNSAIDYINIAIKTNSAYNQYTNLAGSLSTISAGLAAIQPYLIAVLVLVAIGEFIYYSYTEDDRAAEGYHDQQIALHNDIRDLLNCQTSADEGVVSMRLHEMAAYGSPIREKIWSGCTYAGFATKDPADWSILANACWADGTTGNRIGANNKFSGNTGSDARNRKNWMKYNVQFCGYVKDFLSQFRDPNDARIAFAILGICILPKSRAFLVGFPQINRVPKNSVSAFSRYVSDNSPGTVRAVREGIAEGRISSGLTDEQLADLTHELGADAAILDAVIKPPSFVYGTLTHIDTEPRTKNPVPVLIAGVLAYLAIKDS